MGLYRKVFKSDDSKNVSFFLMKCKEIYTINNYPEIFWKTLKKTKKTFYQDDFIFYH